MDSLNLGDTEMGGRFLIPLLDYQRVHMTIYSILSSEQADVLKSCFYFSMFAAAILRRHYKIEARAVAGIAGYRIGSGEKNVLMFAEAVGPDLQCTENGFHAWVEADGWLLDFMAPLFHRIMQGPSKMFQKRLSGVSPRPDALMSPGDFFIVANTERTNDLFEHFVSKPAHIDLLQIAEEWYRRPPKKMLKTIHVGDGKGKIKPVPFIGTQVVGAW